MVEYPVPALLMLSGQIMQLCEQQRFSSEEIKQLRVRLMDPRPDGSIEMQVGIPQTLGHSAWQQFKQ